ncbi:ATPase, T2SS/T4P/T4SS family [Filibacter tadaridae]|uniref:Type II secretion system protein E n=1 Tax=Filibacter tadaridae TaxID=2483811 RepID=A0A3P5XWV5_9BACL|nr:ATPase, T2SS/T4P/T4SS family [Filibacter tadaridae]VDC32627.1 Type II secretion system protein E [Filibacter tadaridae]
MIKRKRIGDLLVDAEAITREQLQTALNEKMNEEKIGDYLIRVNLLTEQQMIEVLEFQLGVPHVHLNQIPIEPEVLKLIPEELAKRASVMPISRERNKLFVAMADPMDYFAIEEIRLTTGYHVEPRISSKSDIYRTITKYYDLQQSMEDAMSDVTLQEVANDAELLDEESPIVRLVNQIIANGVAQNASDIHFDPQENEMRIRYRVDGVLRTERAIPKHMQSIIIARVKILGNLNITENRVPQDGRIKTVINLRAVDIRLSSLPTVFGEKMVMRILDMGSALNSIEKLNFSENNLGLFKKMITSPNGIVLVTGPTGSGKSSTLYAGLSTLNTEGVNIITVEDPVEYQLEGVNQIQVRDDVGLTFASGLRSILRQDPDIVMIGEIRDLETAQIAVRASLTGHLVLSTLHTNSAVESLARLSDMGVEPFLLSSSLVGIVSQRLVRKVCRDCGQAYTPDEATRSIFHKYGMDVTELRKGHGCPSCNGTGYKGRIAIHEVLPISKEIKTIMMTAMNSDAIRSQMEKDGIHLMVEDGLLKVKQGITTLEEVLRVTTLE